MATDPRLAVLSLLALTVTAAGSAPAGPGARFVEVGARRGVDFRHHDYRDGHKFYVETTASGIGWIDHDGDGDPDLYLLNGAPPPGSTEIAAPNRLYENRDGVFVDVTEQAGVGDRGFGMGLCVGDIDADGRADFLVANFGPDRLYHNLGDGRFEDVGPLAGVADPRWSAGCAFGDLDGDGDLDLYVTRYVDFRYDSGPECTDPSSGRAVYCRPLDFVGVTDSLFVNQGDGTFREEGAARGIVGGLTERGLGVVLSDLDRDGDLDIYVANDGSANRLYRNDGRGIFSEVGLLAGAALNAFGATEAGMGIAVGDVDGDGVSDLLLTHFSMETNTLYRGLGDMLFEDATIAAGLASPSYLQVGWGVELFDADNDGDLDLALANGHMQEGIESLEPGLAYEQPNQYFENRGDGTFVDASGGAGSAWSRPAVSRGLAAADFDDDGLVDLAIANTNGAPDLLHNTTADGNHWLGLRLVGGPSNPLAIGARVDLSAGDLRMAREVRSGGGFESQPELRLHFGLGARTGPVEVTVHWPDGAETTRSTADIDRYWTLRRTDRD
ncbi:MAG: CRTAC1 family protein [Thermoanaerobaculia bacterium]